MHKKPLILVIDDDPFYLEHATLALQNDAICKTFLGPNEFEAKVSPQDIKDAALIVVDYDFGISTAVKSDISKYIRQVLGYQKKIALWSLHKQVLEDDTSITDHFDLVLGKNDLTWKNVQPL